jgi:hypothetical protein
VFKFECGFVKNRPRSGRLDSRVTIACQTLEKNPAIAICGLTMLMVAAAAAAMINGLFARQFETKQFRTIWSISASRADRGLERGSRPTERA